MTSQTGRVTGKYPVRTRPPRSGAGFTLIELLLVVAILGIAAMIALPTFARSARSARLKSAVRTVAMASRLARNKAVLQQKDMAVIFYLDRNEIELVNVETASSTGDRDMFFEGRGERMLAGLLDGDDERSEEEAAAALPGISTELVRALPDDVHIVEVESADGLLEDEGAYWVSYYRNGMSDGFTVHLIDSDEHTASVKVDPLSGRVMVTYDS